MVLMATGALLLFEQGRYLDPAAGTLFPPQAALLVGEAGWCLHAECSSGVLRAALFAGAAENGQPLQLRLRVLQQPPLPPQAC
jgi:hypothetical protein